MEKKKAEIRDSLVDNKEWGDKTSENCGQVRDAAGESMVPKTEKRMGVISEPAATGTWGKVEKRELLGQNLRVDI